MDNRLGLYLKGLRARAGLSQELVSAKAQLSETYYGKIEIGKRRPTPDTLEQVLAALGCSPAERQAATLLFAQSYIPAAMLELIRRPPKKLVVALALTGSLLGSPLGGVVTRPDNGQPAGILSPRRRVPKAAEAAIAA